MPSEGEIVVYLVQTKERRELCPGARWDITSRFDKLENRVKWLLKELNNKKHEKALNELKIELDKRIKWKDPENAVGYQEVLRLMDRLLNGEYVRG